MSIVEDLKQQIEELEKKTKELQQKLEIEKQKTEIEYPFEERERYFVLCNDGRIANDCWEGYDCEFTQWSQGNIFKTKQEAEREHDKRELLTRFRQFRDKCNGDWKPTINEKKYYIFFNFEEHKFKIDWFCQIGIFELLGTFKNEADAERAVELFGDEIKRLYLEW